MYVPGRIFSVLLLYYTPDYIVPADVQAYVPGRIFGEGFVAFQQVFGVCFCYEVVLVDSDVRFYHRIPIIVKLIIMADSVIEV
jgi:hypothetical protein